MVKLNNDWDEILKEEFSKDYYLALREKLKDEYNSYTVYPDMHDIFNAFKFAAYKDIKIVILGQDPYHGAGQAHGLCFSVKPNVPLPPSLKNIFKEVYSDVGCKETNQGDLTKWAKQGVLLLNSSLTVRAANANSHQNIGWETFTDNVIGLLNKREKPIIFLLWGGNAKRKARLVTAKQHKLLESVHPSPLSAYGGFFGCKHFSKANEFLLQMGEKAIDWNLCE